jgi:hypothetical protein
MALAAAHATALAAGAPPSPPKGATAATPKPRPLALTDTADKALRAERARRGLKPSAVEPQLEALRAADPWVALVQGADRIGGAGAFAYMALDQAFAELGVPAADRMALADTDAAGDQLAALGAQMKLFEDPALGIPEPWRASFAQLALDLARARRLTAEALAGIDEIDRRKVLAGAVFFVAPQDRYSVDPSPLARAALTALLATDAFLTGLPKNLPPTFAWRTDVPGVTGFALGPFATVAGPLYIGGVDRNEWSLPERAVVVELGGDDSHRPHPTTGPALTGADLSVIIDIAGRDGYEAEVAGTIGGGLFGLSVVRDEAGNDGYSGGAVSLGAGRFGAGLLLDCSGDDNYVAVTDAQGAGDAGVGLLVDGDGDDMYSLGEFGQAAGLENGIGVLADLAGRDVFLAGSLNAQGYGGSAGQFSAGAGMGVLLEVGGDDLYRAIDLAQGFAEGVGTGLLVDGGGNDTFLLTSDGQGRGASVDSSLAPETARGLLIDLGGDDVRLAAEGHAQAASTRASVEDRLDPTGIAVLLDTGGTDVLRCGDEKTCRGVAEGEGRALFIDLGVKPPVRIGLPARQKAKPAPAPASPGKVAK